MRKMTKLGIDELRKEFPVLTRLMMKEALGGNKCLGEAIHMAKSRMGMYVAQDEIDTRIVDYLFDIGAFPGKTKWEIGKIYNENGVPATYSSGILQHFFDGIICGGIGQTNTESIAVVVFDTTIGNTAHAGIYVEDVVQDGVLCFKAIDKNGTTFTIPYLDEKNRSNVFCTYVIPEGVDPNCGTDDPYGGDDCGV